MKFKSLTIPIIPQCFNVSFREPEDAGGSNHPRRRATRMILSDGRVRIFRREVPAGELMAANPSHLLCRSDSFFIGRKVTPLAAGDLLISGQTYFLLPESFFSSALSFASLASSLTSKLLLLRPFEVRKTADCRLQLRFSDELVQRLRGKGEEEEEEEEDEEGVKKRRGMVCTTDEMEREYRELVERIRVWKPKLETIKEKEKRKKKKKEKKKKSNRDGKEAS
ncbi:hypothetical protein AXF42_Ash000653 [Apostasia shenzhenica]|uniref:Uncharacterized protein n=1 Tax=Apostasia shenzhenica TaxID=1088818 RepID=A0A2I0AH06_9ASPA|nr:hypothetical protein AXF42_Ash000653 [Apostasia shenzhenica]